MKTPTPNAYAMNFDALGKPIDQAHRPSPPPWTAPDLIAVFFAVLCISAIAAEVFK